MIKSIDNKFVNSKIGFDDRWVMVIMIPVTALIIPWVFFGNRFSGPYYYTWNIYWTTLLITAANWFGDRWLMVWARTKYPHFKETRQRLRLQSLCLFIYTFIITNTMGYLLEPYCGLRNGAAYMRSLSDILIDSNTAAVFCTLTIVAIYETRYFMNELKQSVEEKEMFKRNSLEAQLSALKTQVNPHFLFNNLNTLCSIIPENPEQAVSFVQQLSKVYRHILEVKDESCIGLADELEVIKAYSFLLKTRFGSNLEVDIRVGEQELHNKVVPLSVQLLMENAIKHNIISAERHLKIEIYTEDGYLIITNNLQRKNQPVDSTSLGLNNIRSRYSLITEKPVLITEAGANFTVCIPLIINRT